MVHRLLVCVALLAAVAFPVSAQTPSGEISGVIVDTSGSVMPGVRVTLTNTATKTVRLTQSNEAGLYVFPAVPPGTYSLKVELEGFSTAEQTNINVQGLTVEAALTGRRDAVHHAAMLDPHTAAELSLDEIAALVEDLLEAHGDWIPPLRRTGEPLAR